MSVRDELIQILLDHPEMIPAFLERVQRDHAELFTEEKE